MSYVYAYWGWKNDAGYGWPSTWSVKHCHPYIWGHEKPKMPMRWCTTQRLANECVPAFTTDGLRAHFYALTAHFVIGIQPWVTESPIGRLRQRSCMAS